MGRFLRLHALRRSGDGASAPHVRASRAGRAVLFALAAARRKVPDLRSHWQGFAIVGIVNSALPFVLFCFAEQTIGASTAGILNATSPFFGAVAAAIWLGEPLTARKIGGMTLGLVGVALLVGLQPEALTRDTVFAIAACLVAALCYGLGAVYAKKRMQGVPSFALACGSQLSAAIILAPVLPFASVPGPSRRGSCSTSPRWPWPRPRSPTSSIFA
jgi:drug/metabolite transporter (DMT)-like permease